MTIFEALVLAHITGDWLLQTEWQAENKAHSWRALGVHLAIYHALLLAVIVLWFHLTGPPVVWAVTFLVITHALLDRRTGLLWVMRTLRLTVSRVPDRWMTIAVDQSIHLLLLGAVAVYLSRYLPA